MSTANVQGRINHKENMFLVISVLTSIVGVLTILYSSIYSRVSTKVETAPIVDNIARLNQRFYSGEIDSNPFIITNEFSELFTKTLKLMQSCELNMREFYGESGIGKTTMLKESLRLLKPYPYLLISLSKTTTIKELAKLMNIVVDDGPIWSDIQLITNQFISKAHQTGKCPIIIIDNANRNREITELFVEMVREHTEKVSLLVVSSDGYDLGLDTAGDRLWTTELVQPSQEFGVNYLVNMNITNNSTISRVLDHTGTNAVLLRYVHYCLNNDQVDFNCLETIIDELMKMKISLLPKTIQQIILETARKLIKEPDGNHSLPPNISEETEKKVYRSNILRQRDENKVIFQNKTVKKYFEKRYTLNKH